MAAELAPVAIQQWNFQKNQNVHRSPSSDTSSSEFFDAEDKLRITSNMEDVKQTVPQPLFNKEYLSSEEALSPVIDETTSEEGDMEEGAVEEELEGSELVEIDLWEEIKVLALEIAITLSMQFVGRPKMVNMHLPYAIVNHHVTSSRADFLPPRSIPIRSPRRTQIRSVTAPALGSRFSGSSLDPMSPSRVPPSPVAESPETYHSRFSGSSYADSPTTTLHSELTPDVGKEHDMSPTQSMKSSKRPTSMFSQANNNISTTFTPPLSEDDASSPTPSFLTSDPAESTISSRPQHSRLRSISSKFSKISFKKDVCRPNDAERRERRSSSMFSGLSKDYQDYSFVEWSQTTHQPPPLAQLQPTTTQRSLPRMVPRGANERAEPICLPPCPDDYDTTSPPELLLPTTFEPVGRKPVASPQFMRRRKSLLGLV
ncbi:hypothetical protein EJ08DRAFT_702221 [Tothia fuscella]|uniref:Uncharacterized protein n=1 Tax=Tothia fuscella TaxID=1048955 RepID=A0A9P4NH76_9PEZI|nr:hypothetical protein EJ08DRAFT_702221 [Tothia fuscella]